MNACVTKTGYPNAISFTDIGAVYEPNLITMEKQKKIKNLQIYISNFEPNPHFTFLKETFLVILILKKKIKLMSSPNNNSRFRC